MHDISRRIVEKFSRFTHEKINSLAFRISNCLTHPGDLFPDPQVSFWLSCLAFSLCSYTESHANTSDMYSEMVAKSERLYSDSITLVIGWPAAGISGTDRQSLPFCSTWTYPYSYSGFLTVWLLGSKSRK